MTIKQLINKIFYETPVILLAVWLILVGGLLGGFSGVKTALFILLASAILTGGFLLAEWATEEVPYLLLLSYYALLNKLYKFVEEAPPYLRLTIICSYITTVILILVAILGGWTAVKLVIGVVIFILAIVIPFVFLCMRAQESFRNDS